MNKVRGWISAWVAAASVLAGGEVTAQQLGRGAQAQRGAPNAQGIEQAVFSRFSDLDDAATLARLTQLQASRAQSATLETLVKDLERGASAAELERSALQLVAKLTEDEANEVLAAVMRRYYDLYMKPSVEAGKTQQAQAFERLIAVDSALTTAALGAPPSGPTRSPRAVRR